MTKCKAILRAILMGITFSIFSPLCVSAQEKESEKPLRPVTSVFTVELGRQSALDTYLTPIRYWGLDVALGYGRLVLPRKSGLPATMFPVHSPR